MKNNIVFNFIPKILESYEYSSINDLVFESIPRGYNIPAAFPSLEELKTLPDKTKVTVFGYIDGYKETQTKGGKRLARIKASLYKDGQSFPVAWTTIGAKASAMVYGLTQKSKGGALLQVTGKLDSFDIQGDDGMFNYKFISQPTLSIISTTTSATTTTACESIMPEPLYNLTKGVKIFDMKNAFKEIIDNYNDLDLKDLLPIEIEKELKMQPLPLSLAYLHGLKSVKQEKLHDFLNYQGFRRRVLVEKIWRIMLDNYKDSALNNLEYQDGNFISQESIANIGYILDKLPFTLTQDQKKATWGVLQNFSTKKQSKNLIFGDVGSGKTMVALIVSYVLYKMGYQCAIMAPTSILARQHFDEAIHILGEEDVHIIHSRTRKKEKDALNKTLASGEPCIVYGTSSIIRLNFTNLKTVFIDEEQKFGVSDKEKLFHEHKTHMCYMTATPIPRTLASSMYSDFKIHKIEQKPAMQLPRITKVSTKLTKQELMDISLKMQNGEQMLVVVPAIASSDIVSSKSAEIKYKALFPDFKIATINGRMTAANIEKNTEDFMSGEIHIMIATTMVDAGFSNKNLSFVMIENPERFGLAQMHQIRGRCGRGDKQGFCYLVPVSENPKGTAKERLDSLVASENGFELSMKDIEIRGSGDLRGSVQTGSEVNMLEWLIEIEEIAKYLKKEK